MLVQVRCWFRFGVGSGSGVGSGVGSGSGVRCWFGVGSGVGSGSGVDTSIFSIFTSIPYHQMSISRMI